MKDRWKIFWTCIIVALVLAIIIGSISASFRQVQLRQYGILYYTVFSKVSNLTARANGNYLVGLDYGFHKFPSGILSVQFKTTTLTKDMSMVEIQGLFTGRLIITEVTPMYTLYGNQYLQFLKSSVQEYTREAIESYSLSQLIYNRFTIQNNVKGLVCLQIQSQYSWIQCDHVSLGRVGANIPEPSIVPVEKSLQSKKIELLEEEIVNQKLLNFYISGGFQMLNSLEQGDSKLFLQVSEMISNEVTEMEQSQRFGAAEYILLSSQFPALKNSMQLKL